MPPQPASLPLCPDIFTFSIKIKSHTLESSLEGPINEKYPTESKEVTEGINDERSIATLAA